MVVGIADNQDNKLNFSSVTKKGLEAEYVA